MANQVKLTIKVADDGSLDVVAKKAKKAAEATDGLGNAQKKAGAGAGNYQKQQKGVAGATSNSTKAFSKMTTGISGGLVPAYATLAANVFAITAAFGALQRAQATAQLEEGLKKVGQAAGQNLPYVASEIRNITGAAVSMKQAMEATALAMSAGFSVSQLEDLTRVAKGASLALGRDMGDALTRLVKGTAKLEPEILDELGILVRLDEASEKYAISIGKSATTLTRFEKQQAFLNETIEQGRKKFDIVAESVEANPYDKLAASFADLSKIVLQFVGSALEPLVTFLAESPGALTAAMLMFGSTIVKQITPAIGELIVKQRQVATEAAIMATKASKVISVKYKEAQDKIKSMDFSLGPKSVQGFKEAYAKGQIGAEELKKKIIALKISETQRTKFAAKEGNVVTQAYRDQTAAIIEQRAALEGLKAVEKEKYTTGAAGAGAKRGSAVSGLTSRGLQEMDKADGAFKKLAVGAKYAGLQVRQVGKNFGKLGFTMKAFTLGARAAAGAATLMGSALLNMIPIVGQILFALSLAAPLIAKLFDKGKAAAAAEEVTESWGTTAVITMQLDEQLKKLTTTEEKYQATLKVRAGLMSQVQSGIQKVIAAQREEDVEDLLKLKEKQISREERLARMIQFYGKKSNQAKRAQSQLTAATANYNERLAEGSIVSAKVAKSMLAEQITRMELAGGTEKYKAELEKLNGVLSSINDDGIDATALSTAIEEATNPTIKLDKEVNAVADSFTELSNISAKSAAKSKGHGSQFLDSFQGIENSIISAGVEANKLGDREFFLKPVAPKDMKLMKDMLAALGLEEDLTKNKLVTIVSIKNAYKEELQTQIDLTEESKRNANIAKDLGAVSANNAALKEQELNFAKKSLENERDRLASLLKTTLLENGNNDQAEAVKKVKAQQLTIDQKIGRTGEDSLLVDKARINEQKKSLDITNKILGAEQKILDIKANASKRALELRRAQQGVAASAADELALLEAKVAAETEGGDKSLRAKQEAAEKKGVELEYQLLDLQFQLEAAKINRLIKEGVVTRAEMKGALATIGNARKLIGEAKTAALGVVTAEFADKKQGDKDAIGLATEKARRESRQLELDFLDQRISRAAAFGNSELQFSLEQLARKQRLSDLQAEMGALSKDSSASAASIESKSLEIARAKLEIEKAIYDKKMKSIDTLESASGSASVGGALRASEARKKRENDIKDLKAQLSEIDQSTAEGKAKADTIKAELEAARALTTKLAISEAANAFSDLSADMAKLGPEGEVMAAMTGGMSNMINGFQSAFEIIGSDSATTADKVTAALGAVSSVISAIGQTQKAASAQRVRAIDSEIAAEKERDGKSEKSLAKIAGLEKKKDNEKRKAFESQKKMQMAQTIISTATGAMAAYTSLAPIPVVGPALGAAAAAMVVAMGAKQLSQIASTSYQGGGSIGGAGAATKISVGSRGSSVDTAKSQGGAGELGYLRGQEGTGGAENFKPAFSGAKYRAEGGNVGLVVGEQGPELFVPQTPGRVVANDDVGGGGSQNVNFSINAVDAAGVEELLINQRGNIIGMLREASNSYGEPFMEKVSTSSMGGATGAGVYGGGGTSGVEGGKYWKTR